MAFIVGAVEPAVLDAHLLRRIARFKRPKRYEFVDELPKTATARYSSASCAPAWRREPGGSPAGEINDAGNVATLSQSSECLVDHRDPPASK